MGVARAICFLRPTGAWLSQRAKVRRNRRLRTPRSQSFFAYLIERKIYTRVDRQKGRFRSFLLASLKNFLADASDRERTLKRGGGQDFLPLYEEQVEEAESLFQTHSATSNEDRLFDRSWAEVLVAAGLERLSADYKGEAKEKLFNE